MGWKALITFSIFVLLGLLLATYYFLPLSGESLFVTAPPLNSSFPSYTNDSLQFYPNMRYPTTEISYKIEDCDLKKTQDMTDAFDFIQERTIISFYLVESGEQIFVSCSSRTKQSGDYFIAGEGGPTNITATDRFNVIHQGKIELIRESKCPNPNVGIHELLHALGFAHSQNPDSVMYEVSKCSQVVTDDIIEALNELYETPSLPDLAFNNISANITGRYLDARFSVVNHGLADIGDFEINIYSDENIVDNFELNGLDIGYGRTVTLKNLRAPRNPHSLIFEIKSNESELDKKNNKIELFIEA